jgi:Iron-containing redox enzyme
MSGITGDFRPRFRGRIVDDGDVLLVDPEGRQFRPGEITRDDLATLVAGMDGSMPFSTLMERVDPALRESYETIVAELEDADLIDDDRVPDVIPGLEFLIELEELVDGLTAATIFKNPFWQACLNASQACDMPLNVVHGMVIENWQFLTRESYFDAPVLSYVPNRAVRLAINEFFSEEYGHDEILLRALETIGLTRSDLEDSIPLPETLGLCNALAYWSLNDPLFFFTTLGLLEGQGMKSDSFIDACERMKVDPTFVRPLRTHSNINIDAEHGNLTRLIFSKIGFVDRETRRRFRAQTYLFVELYDAFYRGVWEHYSRSPTLLRRVSEL